MKKLSPALVFSVLGIATFASLVGTVSGTLAWYAYNTRTTISYSGTSVENTVQLQIGLSSDTPIVIDNDDWNNTMGEPEVVNGKYCYFAPLGYGLDSGVINAYLGAKGYATTELSPVTSGYYDPEDEYCDFSLKAAPSTEHHACDLPASQKNYLKLSFIFRATRSKTDPTDFAEDQELWLTDAKGAASSAYDGNVYKAMRIFFDRDDANYDTDFIINPDASSSGETKVGGLLDLTCDEYYDFDNDGEIVYGDWDKNALPDPTIKRSNYYQPGGEAPIYDLNNDGSIVTSADTFKSRHHTGSAYYTYEALNSIPFKTAKYKTVEAVKPARNSINGRLTNIDPDHPTSVCKTGGAADKYIAHVDAYIWLEGWDFSVIDEEQLHRFDLGLTFEINKVAES